MVSTIRAFRRAWQLKKEENVLVPARKKRGKIRRERDSVRIPAGPGAVVKFLRKIFQERGFAQFAAVGDGGYHYYFQ